MIRTARKKEVQRPSNQEEKQPHMYHVCAEQTTHHTEARGFPHGSSYDSQPLAPRLFPLAQAFSLLIIDRGGTSCD